MKLLGYWGAWRLASIIRTVESLDSEWIRLPNKFLSRMRMPFVMFGFANLQLFGVVAPNHAPPFRYSPAIFSNIRFVSYRRPLNRNPHVHSVHINRESLHFVHQLQSHYNRRTSFYNLNKISRRMILDFRQINYRIYCAAVRLSHRYNRQIIH